MSLQSQVKGLRASERNDRDRKKGSKRASRVVNRLEVRHLDSEKFEI